MENYGVLGFHLRGDLIFAFRKWCEDAGCPPGDMLREAVCHVLEGTFYRIDEETIQSAKDFWMKFHGKEVAPAPALPWKDVVLLVD